MTSNELKLGFVGFGEAGYHLAKGLRGAGLARIHAYDIHANTADRGEKIRQRASETEVTLCESNARLAAECNVLLSTVTANQAAAAAEQNAPHLTANHIYADLNSISPDLKRSIAQLIEARGGGALSRLRSCLRCRHTDIECRCFWAARTLKAWLIYSRHLA